MATADIATGGGTAAMPVKHHGWLTVGVMGAMVMQILDTTIANVALPHMQTSLGATMDSVSWVLTSYIVAAAIATPVTGWLADRFGSRNLFLFAVGTFIFASMLCGAATNLETMVAFRIFQGVAGAFIGPLSQTVMLDINPPERHAKAMSMWGMGVMIGPIMGPVLGGWLTENYNWRWVFYVNLPIGILTLALLWALLPSRGQTKRSFDVTGFAMLSVALASFQLMLDRGPHEDWFASWEIIIEAAVAFGAFWMFLVHLLTAKKPLFERQMFKNRNLATGLMFMVVIGITSMAPMALLPPMLQQLYGYPVIDTGMLLAPRGVGVFITMFIGGQLMGRGVDPRYLIASGLLISSWSLWHMAHWSLDIGWQTVAISGFVQGLGMGFAFMPLNAMAFITLPPQWRTDGASSLNLIRSLGSSAGISMVTALLSRNTQISHSDLAAHITSFSIDGMDPTLAQALGSTGDTVLSMANAEVTRQAMMIAYLDDFYLMSIITLLALPLVLLLQGPPRGAKLEKIVAE
ncbi:DHA2 family efflux MFS transporter permease subunit [Sphingomonas sp. C3-2]|uniref:DHA2 family efflux MFS transporter permease subunit n=1 Tax=Sphingomonas sp. C3-2 TaxID=3062169 RepID=UPI00294B5B6B|nr:DHA2 family efflux MFS transporter permease subunit [Sphingomonas sp. C3-2]